MGRPLRQMSWSPGEMGQVAHPLLQNLVSSLSCDFAVGAGFSMDGRGKHTPGDRTMLQTDSKALGFLPTPLSLV